MFPLCYVIFYVVLDCDRYCLVYLTFCSSELFTVWQDCVFLFYFVDLLDMNSMEEDEILYNAIQVIGNSGTSPSIIGLYDVLRNIEQMLIPFKHYIEASEASMTQVSLMG